MCRGFRNLLKITMFYIPLKRVKEDFFTQWLFALRVLKRLNETLPIKLRSYKVSNTGVTAPDIYTMLSS